MSHSKKRREDNERGKGGSHNSCVSCRRDGSGCKDSKGVVFFFFLWKNKLRQRPRADHSCSSFLIFGLPCPFPFLPVFLPSSVKPSIPLVCLPFCPFITFSCLPLSISSSNESPSFFSIDRMSKICCSPYTANEEPVRIQYKFQVPIYVFPAKKLHLLVSSNNVLSPNFHIPVSVSDLYIPRIGLPILLQPNRNRNI